MMKKISTVTLGLTLILGMATAALARDDGTYDMWGTLSYDGTYANGNTTDCSLAANGLPCPSQVNVCIQDLNVSSDHITSNGAAPTYGIAMGILDGDPLDMDFDGAGPVDLTVGSSGADDFLADLVVGSTAGGACSGEAQPCVSSVTAGMVAPGGGAGTVTGKIPLVVADFPILAPPMCSGGQGQYPEGSLTTETATAKVSNESGTNQTISATGSRLSGLDLTLVGALTGYRATVAGIVVGQDSMITRTFALHMCKRTSSGVSCIPGSFSCPAEND